MQGCVCVVFYMCVYLCACKRVCVGRCTCACVRESVLSGEDILKMHQPWGGFKESLGSKEDRLVEARLCGLNIQARNRDFIY